MKRIKERIEIGTYDYGGFPEGWLPVILNAIHNDQVVWIDPILDSNYDEEFEWSGLRFGILQFGSFSRWHLELLSGTPTEDLTLAILRG